MKHHSPENWMPFTGLHGELLHPNKTAMLEQLRSNSIQFLKSFHKTQNLNHLPSQGWPLAARENLYKLQQGQAVAVITGQQPCLWGGPALVIHKIATTVSICAWLQREGIPAVPLFWNASEDHDLHEMFQVEGFYPDGRIQSHRKKNERLLSAEALKAQPPSEFPPSFSPWMAKLWGQNQNSWAEQLSHVLMQMFSADGLIALEPRQLAPQSRDFWVSVEARQSQLIQAYDSDEAAITRSGFSLQAPRRHALPIFALHNTGERLSLSQLGKKNFNLAEIWTPDTRPSTGALLRPLFAQAQLPILVSVLGPAEMKYHRQLYQAFEVLNLPRPLLWPRLRGTYVPRELQEELTSKGISPQQLVQGPENLRDILAQKHPSLEAQLFSGHLQALYAEQAQRYPQASFGLQRFEQDLFKAFHRFEKHLEAQEVQKLGFSPQHIRKIQEWFAPRGVPQERRLGWSFILNDWEHFQSVLKYFADPFNFEHRIYD